MSWSVVPSRSIKAAQPPRLVTPSALQLPSVQTNCRHEPLAPITVDGFKPRNALSSATVVRSCSSVPRVNMVWRGFNPVTGMPSPSRRTTRASWGSEFARQHDEKLQSIAHSARRFIGRSRRITNRHGRFSPGCAITGAHAPQRRCSACTWQFGTPVPKPRAHVRFMPGAYRFCGDFECCSSPRPQVRETGTTRLSHRVWSARRSANAP
jgi:hypothetical protein